MITKFVAKVQTNGKKVDKNDINFKIVANFAVEISGNKSYSI